MKTILAVVLFILTSISLSAGDSAPTGEGGESYTYYLYLQPLADSELYSVPVGSLHSDGLAVMAEKRLEFTVLERDNSAAVIRLSHPEVHLVVRICNPGYEDKILSLRAAGGVGTGADLRPTSIKLGETSPDLRPTSINPASSSSVPPDFIPTSLNFAILSPASASSRFEAAWPTGIQPKSVTFISNTLVAVPLLADRGIDIIDITDGSTRRIAPPPAWARHEGFVESLVLPKRGELWVSQMTTAAIHVFDLGTLAYKLTIPTGGRWSKVLAYNPALDRVFFTHWLSEDVSIINPYTYKEERREDYKAVPRGLSFSADGQSMYLAQYEVAGRSAGRVLKVDLVTLEVSATMGVAGAKRHIVKDEARGLLYVSDMARNAIEVFSLTTDRLLRTIPVSAKPNTIQLSPDGSRLYVSCRGPNNPTLDYLYKGLEMGKVHIVDTASLQVVETHEGGNQPTGLDISPDGRRLVFSDFLDNRIRVYLLTPAERPVQQEPVWVPRRNPLESL